MRLNMEKMKIIIQKEVAGQRRAIGSQLPADDRCMR
jgi:hypothetical protein